jgi:uncharacterized RDD family membrane protein YckC
MDKGRQTMNATNIVGEAGMPRLVAAVVDNAIILILPFVVIAVASPADSTVFLGILCVGWLGYFFICEAIWSRTPGKLMFGLVVRKLDGSSCDVKAAFLRTIARLFEVNPFLLGGLPAGLIILSSSRKQRLGDQLAGTLVVKINK